MARAVSTDFYHSFKYQVQVVTSGIEGASNVGQQGGFTSVTMPEATVESVEYKEGTYLYRRKYPGDVTFSDITLNKGVVKKDLAFYNWLRACYLGQEYRVDLVIHHFHRSDVTNLTDFSKAQAKRKIKCFECFGMRTKPGADFDAQTSDISLEEIDISLEYFEIEDTNS